MKNNWWKKRKTDDLNPESKNKCKRSRITKYLDGIAKKGFVLNNLPGVGFAKLRNKKYPHLLLVYFLGFADLHEDTAFHSSNYFVVM